MPSQHDDFLEGFSDALGIKDPNELERHYESWIREVGMSDAERIDIEGSGYQAGLEAGYHYKQSQL
jgi:hypothetical protein